MKLIITGSRSIQEVQRDFNAEYPYLKLEFFRLPRRKEVNTSAANLLDRSLKLNQARRYQYDGELELQDTMKVNELELQLKEQYGLNAQVFRKSGNVWLETTMSDAWTLKQQNDHGMEISTFSSVPAIPDQDEYRVHE